MTVSRSQMQSFLWLYFMASLEMVFSGKEPIGLSVRRDEEEGIQLAPPNPYEIMIHPSELEERKKNNLNVIRYDPKFNSIHGGASEIGDINELMEDESSTFTRKPSDGELSELENYLMELLRRPGAWEAPIVLIDQPPEDSQGNINILDSNNSREIRKRTRYYRRYPWKRQNSRSRNYNYDPAQVLCIPSKQDVVRLLVALHEARNTNTNEHIRFCNRHRPAGTIFTNIRFLGRRK